MSEVLNCVGGTATVLPSHHCGYRQGSGCFILFRGGPEGGGHGLGSAAIGEGADGMIVEHGLAVA